MKSSLLILFLAFLFYFFLGDSSGDQLKYLLRPVGKEDSHLPRLSPTRMNNRQDDSTGRRRPLLVPYNRNPPAMKTGIDQMNKRQHSDSPPMFNIHNSHSADLDHHQLQIIPQQSPESLFNVDVNETLPSIEYHMLEKSHLRETGMNLADPVKQNIAEGLSNDGVTPKHRKSSFGLLSPSSNSNPRQEVNFLQSETLNKSRKSFENFAANGSSLRPSVSPSNPEEYSERRSSNGSPPILRGNKGNLPPGTQVKRQNISDEIPNTKVGSPVNDVSSSFVGGYYDNQKVDNPKTSSENNFLDTSLFYSNKRPLGSFFTSPASSSLYSVRIRTTPYQYSLLMSPPSSPLSIKKLNEGEQRTPAPFSEGEFLGNKQRRFNDPYGRFRNDGISIENSKLLTAVMLFTATLVGMKDSGL